MIYYPQRKMFSLEEKIIFRADQVDFSTDNGFILCTLNGEFLNDGHSFNPSLTCNMLNVPVGTYDLKSILIPVYHSLIHERSLLSEQHLESYSH